MRRLRWGILVAGLACLLGVSVALIGAQSSRSSAAEASAATAISAPIASAARTATAAQQSALWRPTYEAALTCNHLPSPVVAQVIVPDVAGMTTAEARCALIRAGSRSSIDEIVYIGLPADAPRVADYRIFAVANDPHSDHHYQRLIPGATVAPDTSLTVMLYGPRG